MTLSAREDHRPSFRRRLIVDRRRHGTDARSQWLGRWPRPRSPVQSAGRVVRRWNAAPGAELVERRDVHLGGLVRPTAGVSVRRDPPRVAV